MTSYGKTMDAITKAEVFPGSDDISIIGAINRSSRNFPKNRAGVRTGSDRNDSKNEA